jgi:hypothetical protein
MSTTIMKFVLNFGRHFWGIFTTFNPTPKL